MDSSTQLRRRARRSNEPKQPDPSFMTSNAAYGLNMARVREQAKLLEQVAQAELATTASKTPAAIGTDSARPTFAFLYSRASDEIGKGLAPPSSAAAAQLRVGTGGPSASAAPAPQQQQQAHGTVRIDTAAYLKAYQHGIPKGPQNPLFTTSSRVIGSRPPNEATVVAERHAIAQQFSNSFNGRCSDQSLNTTLTKSKMASMETDGARALAADEAGGGTSTGGSNGKGGGEASGSASNNDGSNGGGDKKPGIMGGGIRGSLRSRKRDEDGDGGNEGRGGGGGGGRGRGKGGENDSQGSGPAPKRSKGEGRTKPPERWRTQKMAEDYMNLVGDMLYPKVSFGPYGYDYKKGEVPLERPNTLGVLLNPARRRTVIERWSPYEVACFEGAITLVGKNFYEIAKALKTKSTKEVIEFYYVWKMTSHYQQWKRGFEPMDPHPFHIAAPSEG